MATFSSVKFPIHSSQRIAAAFVVRIWILLLGFVACALSSDTVQFKLEPARWSHELQFLVDGQPLSFGSSITYPETTGGSDWYVRLDLGTSLGGYTGTSFVLWDWTLNESVEITPNLDPNYIGDRLFDVRGNFIPSFGSPMAYFSVPGSRAANSLVVVYPSLGISSPLSLSSRWGPNPLNSGDPWVEAMALYYPGEYYVLDLTTYERAPSNLNFLPAAQWGPGVQDVLVDSWTLVFAASDAGYHFILEYGFPGSDTPWMSKTLIPVLNLAEGASYSTVALPRGAHFYVHRLVDNAETMLCLADPNPPYWDFTASFPVRSRRTQDFYVNSSVSGSFVARQPFGSFPAQITATGQFIQFPNGYGGTNDFWYDVYSAEIDDQMVFALERDGIETLPENSTTWWGSFDPNAPPAAEALTLDVFWKSAAGVFITTPDGQQINGEQGALTSESRNSVWATGPISQYNLNYYRVSLSVIPYAGASWGIAYPDSYGVTQSYSISPGYYDWREWYPLPSSLQFQIAPSRYGHDLRLRQPHSTSEYFLNQSGSLGAFYEGGQIAYWYSVGDGWAIPGIDFWVFDATTNESSQPNSTNLADWFHAAPPMIEVVDDPTLGDGVIHLRVGVDSYSVLNAVVEKRCIELNEDWSVLSEFLPQPGGSLGNNYSADIYASSLRLGYTYEFRATAFYSGNRSASSAVTASTTQPYPMIYNSIAAGFIDSSCSAARLQWNCTGPTSEGTFIVESRTSSTSQWRKIAEKGVDTWNEEIGDSHTYAVQPIGIAPNKTYQFRVRMERVSDAYFQNLSGVAMLIAPLDSDGDGISDDDENYLGTEPDEPDSDGDGYSDGEEISGGTDPNNPDDHPNYPPGGGDGGDDGDGDDGGGGGGGGGGDNTPPPPPNPDVVPDVPVIQLASLDLTELTRVKPTGGMALGDDGKIAFYEVEDHGFKVAVWQLDGTYKVGYVPKYDPEGAPLTVVGINSDGYLFGNSRGYNKDKRRVVPTVFEAEPGWDGADASISYPFNNPNEDCFVTLYDGDTATIVNLPSVVQGVSRIGRAWGTKVDYRQWDGRNGYTGVAEQGIRKYIVWNQTFLNFGNATPSLKDNFGTLDANFDGVISAAEFASIETTYSPQVFLSKLIDATFSGARGYGEFSASRPGGAGGPSTTPAGSGFQAGQFPSGPEGPSIEKGKTNNTPQAVSDVNLITNEVQALQQKVPSEFADFVKIQRIIDNANGDTIVAKALVWMKSKTSESPAWRESIVKLKDGLLHIVKSKLATMDQINASGLAAARDSGQATALIEVEVKFLAEDGAELPEWKVVLFSEKVKILVKIAQGFDSLDKVLENREYRSLLLRTSGTNPDGARITLGEDNTKFSSAAAKTELKIELDRSSLRSIGVLPTVESDSVKEIAWYDYVADPTQSSTADSLAWEGANPYGPEKDKRGRCYDGGKIAHNEDRPLDKTFAIAGGAQLMRAEISGATSEMRQLSDQADVFYISGHGSYGEGTLRLPAQVAAGDVSWNQDMEIVIVAGCSIFGIQNVKYRYSSMNYADRKKYDNAYGGAPDPSPGERWEPIKPDIKIGYCFAAPLDTQGADAIADTYQELVNSGLDPIAAWGQANRGTSGENACAIDTRTSPHSYWYFKNVSTGPLTSDLQWTKVDKQTSGW